MPEKRLEKTRETLPGDYQFGQRKSTLGMSINFVKQYDVQADQNPPRLDGRLCDRCGALLFISGNVLLKPHVCGTIQ